MSILLSKSDKRNTPQEKSIRFPLTVHNQLQKLSEKLGRNKNLLFVQMVEYFYRSGKDPLDISEELLRKALSRNHDAYTSFIKSQEKVLLIPMRIEMERMIKNQEQIVSFFNDQVLKANQSLIENQDIQMKGINESVALLKVLYEDREIKRMLQQKFLIILDTYINNRESLGSFKTKERDELAELARNQIATM